MIALLSIVLLAIVHSAPSHVRRVPVDLAVPTPGMADLLMVESGSALRVAPRPLCALDVCPPVVDVPGLEPRWDVHGGRTELLLSLLDRMDLGGLSGAARWIAATGLTVDYRLPDRAQAVQVSVYMRWRIDAFASPLARAE